MKKNLLMELYAFQKKKVGTFSLYLKFNSFLFYS